MQNKLGLLGGDPYISKAESHSPFCYSSERWFGRGLIVDSTPYLFDQVYASGNLATGLARASLAHMTDGLYLCLMKRSSSNPVVSSRKSDWLQQLSYRKWHFFHQFLSVYDFGKGNVQETQARHIGKGGALSFILERVTPLMFRNRWSRCQHYPPFPLFILAAAFFPLLNNLSSNLLAIPIKDTTTKIVEEKEKSVQSYCKVEHIEEHNMPQLSRKTNRSFTDVVEPRTGINFPADLVSTESGSGNTSLISQVLVGVGSRSTTIAKVKSINVYAFGLYVHLDCLRNKLEKKYYDVPPEELNNQPEFFEDLLRQDSWMTVRLVVHLKGLKLGTVQNAFKCALQRRLKRIKGVADDDGLNAFCDYFSKDILLSPGTTVDFHRLPGGHLRTEIDGKELGTIYSRDLCRAFFEMYIGEGPISSKARQEIGENIGRVLKKC